MIAPPPSAPPASLPRVSVAWDGQRVPTLPLVLRGDEACVVLSEIPPVGTALRLLLDWPDGRTTVLAGRLRDVAVDGHAACIAIRGVERDWVPFLDWLGRRAPPPGSRLPPHVA